MSVSLKMSPERGGNTIVCVWYLHVRAYLLAAEDGYPCPNFKGWKRVKTCRSFCVVDSICPCPLPSQLRRDLADEINFSETSPNSFVLSFYLMSHYTRVIPQTISQRGRHREALKWPTVSCLHQTWPHISMTNILVLLHMSVGAVVFYLFDS